jgi:uncharacterized membrane protein
VPKTKTARLLELDATRGAAMLAVLASHSTAYLRNYDSTLGLSLFTVGLLATPTFLLLSGMINAYLIATAGHKAEQLRARLLDRGLFLLVVVHLVLCLTHVIWEPVSTAFGRNFFITDAVGICLIVVALIGRYATRNQLLCGGLGLLVTAWLITNNLKPGSEAGQLLMRLLVGKPYVGDEEGWIVPIVPYLGLFLIGVGAGIEYSGRRLHGTPIQSIARVFLIVGVSAVVVVFIAKLCWLAAKPFVPDQYHALLSRLTDPRQKMPPGPAYIFWFGGAGMAMTGVIAWFSDRQPGRQIAEALAVIGRSSLFIFVVQYWLTDAAAALMHLQGGPWLWLTALLVSIICTWLAAFVWDKANGNRLLTLGLRKTFARPKYVPGNGIASASEV